MEGLYDHILVYANSFRYKKITGETDCAKK